jgi:Transaldolase/Fructose-6-phosphate aldolase
MAGLANSCLAFAAFQEIFTGPRWDALRAKGAQIQRPLWASAGVENAQYPDTLYVTELVVPSPVNTMPEKTLDAFTDHGEVNGDRVSGRLRSSDTSDGRFPSALLQSSRDKAASPVRPGCALFGEILACSVRQLSAVGFVEIECLSDVAERIVDVNCAFDTRQPFEH